MSIIFEGRFDGTESHCEKLRKIILKENPKGGFIRVSFNTESNQYFAKNKKTVKGVARDMGERGVLLFKTLKSGLNINIHAVNITDIKLLPFSGLDKIRWGL